jgi:NTP pyrophosphatase (non-canonical NTP hydrolase)
MITSTNGPLNNLINYALNSSNGVYKQALTHIIACQCAIVSSDFDRVISSVENIRALRGGDEECARLLGDIDIIISDKEWTYSQYKQKSLLSKINRYFEFCYENVSLELTDEKMASLYLEFVKSRLEMEFGFSYLALARYYMAAAKYETVFAIIETVINKFPDSKYEYLALSDLLEIYKMEYQSLERSNEDFGPIIEKIVQILLYILKSYSYQPRSFYTIIKFAYIVFKYERGVTSLSFFEKLSETYSEAIYEEEIKLEFVNYYIGRSKFKEAIAYLNEYENIFNKTTRKNIINLYKLECYICLKDSINAQNIYKAVDEKSFNENNDALIKLYHLVAKFAVLLEEAGCLADALSVYEKIYKNIPLKKLKEEALYKLVTININYYFNNKEKMSDEIKNIARGYCVSFMSKYSKSPRVDEIKLIYDGLNINNNLKSNFIQQPSAEALSKAPLNSAQPRGAASEVKTIAEIKTGGAIKVAAADKSPLQGVANLNNKINTASAPDKNISVAAAKPDGAPGSSDAVKLDPALNERALKPEGFDYIKFILYSSITAVYIYVFLALQSASVTVFYSKMLLSYFPVLALTGFLLFSLFKKMKIFE